MRLRKVDSIARAEPGDVAVFDTAHGIIWQIVCPRCRRVAGIAVAPGRWTLESGDAKDPASATIGGSILHDCGWHGWVRDGALVEC